MDRRKRAYPFEIAEALGMTATVILIVVLSAFAELGGW